MSHAIEARDSNNFKNKRKENNMVSNNKSPRYGKEVAEGRGK